ncbi:hypothetical protein BG452_10170 [Streptomyces sp. CBMA123]|nr:hypothetical protein [Streptomyces sp. CBMA123]
MSAAAEIQRSLLPPLAMHGPRHLAVIDATGHGPAAATKATVAVGAYGTCTAPPPCPSASAATGPGSASRPSGRATGCRASPTA